MSHSQQALGLLEFGLQELGLQELEQQELGQHVQALGALLQCFILLLQERNCRHLVVHR